MLPNLFAQVPNVRRLSVSVTKHSCPFEEASLFVETIPLAQLVDFELLSLHQVWSFDGISTLLRQMPSLQTLRFHISAKDERLVQQEAFAEILPRSVKQIHFLIYYPYTRSKADVAIHSLTSSWSSTFPIRCFLKEEAESLLMLTTSSFSSCPAWLDLPPVFGKQLGRDCRYTSLVDDLYVSEVVRISICDDHLRAHCLSFLRTNR